MRAVRLDHCWQMLRHFGPAWMMSRAYYSVRLRSGMIRRELPATEWEDQPLSGLFSSDELASPDNYLRYRLQTAPKFFFDAGDAETRETYRQLLSRWESKDESAVSLADNMSRGIARYFSHEDISVGLPPNWHADPYSGYEFPSDRHWSQISDFKAGDIKLTWELNRFGFVFALVRAGWRIGNDSYAELFWRLVESWRIDNPPERGVNWKCGQEISLRVMAWCFGLYGFANSPATTADRVSSLAQMIAVSGQRIEANINYALNQQNNHGISEAMGLWTIGSLFPEFRHAARWSRTGRALLESQAKELIYDDGAFSQHSMNYHRLMLHNYVWSMRIGDILNQPFSDELRDRIGAAGNFVYQVQDDSTGQVPCYGQDDGALILPLDECGYRDYRPVVQATHFLLTGQRRLEAGPWDEDLLWLFGPNALEKPVNSAPRSDLVAPIGGYMTLRSNHGFAFTRAATFQHRPAQADMLHVDIWWRGLNIALDPGTYSYNSAAPWNNALAGTRYHNTVTVDALDQMDRAGRFLWLPWIRGVSLNCVRSETGQLAAWEGMHNGYLRLQDPVWYRRSLVRLGDEHWLIIDSLSARKAHDYRLHWLLIDAPHQINADRQSIDLQTTSGNYHVVTASDSSSSRWRVDRGDSAGPVGWRSKYYHHREPALAVSAEDSGRDIVFATLFGPQARTVSFTDNCICATGADWSAIVRLNLSARRRSTTSIEEIEMTGSLTDSVTPQTADAMR